MIVRDGGSGSAARTSVGETPAEIWSAVPIWPAVSVARIPSGQRRFFWVQETEIIPNPDSIAVFPDKRARMPADQADRPSGIGGQGWDPTRWGTPVGVRN
ncbi:MAG: hypothetical protein DWI69_14160 [Chloroflexi bacterium]|nr:MAG: hypothetical protein DWI69_14160 [Chloroflexota bacterium]